MYFFRHLAFVFIFTMGLIIQANATSNRYAAIVVDGTTGKVLHAEKAYERRHPASLTKKMTLYIVFEALKARKINLNTHFKISPLAARQIPCKLGLRAGDTISVESIIKGMITKSANDASVVIAEGLAGSLPKFAQIMNKKAKELGMHATLFFNPSGVPDSRQITTAMDMAILAQALYRDFPEYSHYFQTKRFTYLGVSHNNHNHMLGKFPGLDGIKTGFVNASGFCISTSAVRYDANGEPRRLFAVVMGEPNRHIRDKKTAQLLEANFRKIGATTVNRLSKPYTVPGTKGSIKTNKETKQLQPDIEVGMAETEGSQIDSVAAEQHSPLGPSRNMTAVKAEKNAKASKDSSMLNPSLKQQEPGTQLSPEQQLNSQLIQVNATEQRPMSYQTVQAAPTYIPDPQYTQQPTYAQNNVQVPIEPVQVVTPAQQPQVMIEPAAKPMSVSETYPSSQQMLEYVKATDATPVTAPVKTRLPVTTAVKEKAVLKTAEKVTTLVDNSMTQQRALPENWVVPKAPVSQVKSSLAPTKVSSHASKKIKHGAKRASKKLRSGTRRVV